VASQRFKLRRTTGRCAGGDTSRFNSLHCHALLPLLHHLQMGLWHEGSYAISPGADSWAFAPGAWALYSRVDVAAATTWQLRITPLSASRNVTLSLGSPSAAAGGTVLATFCAACSGAPAEVMGTYAVNLAGSDGDDPSPLTVKGGQLFLVPDGECIIDWFRLL
jgi:hypothetical protein